MNEKQEYILKAMYQAWIQEVEFAKFDFLDMVSNEFNISREEAISACRQVFGEDITIVKYK